MQHHTMNETDYQMNDSLFNFNRLRNQNYYKLVIPKHIVTSFVKQRHNLCNIVERAGSHHKPDDCCPARKRTGL